jgi:hypothetical protein
VARRQTVYDLQGRRMQGINGRRGLFIETDGSKVRKVIEK